MSDFTYALPFSNEKYLSGILYELKRNGKYDVAHLLRGATVSVEQGSYYVGRWGRADASAAFVNFYVHPQYLDQLQSKGWKLKKSCVKFAMSLFLWGTIMNTYNFPWSICYVKRKYVQT